MIDGILCQNYSREIEYAFIGFPPPQYSYFYTSRAFSLALSDSLLLYYNDSLNVFDTLMDFNAQLGDSWVTRIDYDYCGSSIYHDTVKTTVTAITTELVNGRSLSKYSLNRELNWYPQSSVSYSEEYYQQFGADFLFAVNYPCNFLDAGVERELRCFYMDTGTSNAYEYKPFPGNCDYIESLGIDELSTSDSKIRIKVTDLLGRETQIVPNTPLIYIYSDGTVEKVFMME